MKNLILLALLALVPMKLSAVSADCEVSKHALCADSVINSKIADNAVTSSKILNGTIGLDDLGATATTYVDVTLSAAQLDALNATPITILAAPGAGLVTEVSGGLCFVDFQATRLELGSGVLDFKYTDGSGVAVMTAVPNTTVELNADTYYRSIMAAGVPVPNAAIVAHASADVTSGDSIIKCRLYYRTVTIADI